MALKVSQLTKETTTVDVRVGDGPEDVVLVTFRPGMFTLAMADDVAGLIGDPLAGIKVIPTMLEPILVDWDLLAEDGTPLPCNADTLRLLPLEFVGRLFGRIQAESQPDPLTPGASEDGSQQTGSLVTVPTGTDESS